VWQAYILGSASEGDGSEVSGLQVELDELADDVAGEEVSLLVDAREDKVVEEVEVLRRVPHVPSHCLEQRKKELNELEHDGRFLLAALLLFLLSWRPELALLLTIVAITLLLQW
jgi:hypothetical protein